MSISSSNRVVDCSVLGLVTVMVIDVGVESSSSICDGYM